MSKCPRCSNENLKENQNFCQICGLKLSMSNEEVIKHLEWFISDCKEFVCVEPTEKDVQALEIALAVLKETARGEVPVQEQLAKLFEGITLSKWEQLKICIDREFKSQANRITFKSSDTFKKSLKLDITQ